MGDLIKSSDFNKFKLDLSNIGVSSLNTDINSEISATAVNNYFESIIDGINIRFAKSCKDVLEKNPSLRNIDG